MVFVSQFPLIAPLDDKIKALSGGSRALGVVEGDTLYVRVAGLTPQNRNTSVLHALRRLPTIASTLSHHEERIPDDVSTCGDVDACSRASRANKLYNLIYV